MKKLAILLTSGFLSLLISNQIYAQNDPIHGLLPIDSIPAINQPQGIMLNGQTDDLPNLKNKFQPPSTIIQKNNFYDIRILPINNGNQISIENAEIQTNIKIIDINGRLCMNRNYDESNFIIHLSNFKSGTYILFLSGKSQKSSKKIIKI